MSGIILLLLFAAAYIIGAAIPIYLFYRLIRWAVRDTLDIRPEKKQSGGGSGLFWWSCLFMLILGLVIYLVASHG
jgi:hypothetical protein